MKRITSTQLLPVKMALVKQQDHCCPLCGIDFNMVETKNIVVDHDHKTGVIRAALCRNCNGMEGKVKHYGTRAKRGGTYEEWLKRLLEYYEHHETPRTGLLHPTHRTEDEKRLRRNAQARKRRAAKKRT